MKQYKVAKIQNSTKRERLSALSLEITNFFKKRKRPAEPT
ncbi:hypothetical protein PB1_05432 [Bacillus methanolicus PB1]|uniref:Uncharacterized protein n=1 Tax=Bacillus methanolicus PB1 TaxID=997296 RepID=I3DZW0_BACMT|nr:hypothetical protein PB1_05432 [Bacillus methanolicus PB1]